ncbi:MAG TPA: GGDEF domain-containing protein [Xanthobacteraceae bacterium]|nr:GGDEF domain-containing protein [Xanthobacteraceae bacterium]
MSLLGPVVVVAEHPATDMVEALSNAGAFPIVEACWADARSAIDEIQPSALLLAAPEPPPDPRLAQVLTARIEGMSLFMPVLARLADDGMVPIPYALAVSVRDPMSRLIDRLRSALRVRNLHATVLRRSTTPGQPAKDCAFPLHGNLEHATVLCVGRGRFYPALAVAVGERVGLIGAMSVETAARFLNSRDIEGIVIGDGFGPRVVEALLTVLAEDARFRDLPVGVLGGQDISDNRLPNLVQVDRDPDRLVECLLPFVRLQAFEGHLKRLLKSLETDGTLDPATGLFARAAFWNDLERAVKDAESNGGCLSVARFSFEETSDGRAHLDAARLFSRLVRNIDFACQEQDGSILAAFTETDLRSAHVVARRIASVLKHTMLSPDHDRNAIRPTVTLATLKPTDNLSTLVARVGTYPKVATG